MPGCTVHMRSSALPLSTSAENEWMHCVIIFKAITNILVPFRLFWWITFLFVGKMRQKLVQTVFRSAVWNIPGTHLNVKTFLLEFLKTNLAANLCVFFLSSTAAIAAVAECWTVCDLPDRCFGKSYIIHYIHYSVTRGRRHRLLSPTIYRNVL